MRTIVYIDGWNLYFGSVSNTPYKWLDLESMCDKLLPNHHVVQIKYFTARVLPRSSDPEQTIRQDTYLRAIDANPKVEITFGRFAERKKWLKSVKGGKRVQVWSPEEKGSDVNLATNMLSDAFSGSFDAAILVSDDSDFKMPVEVIATRLGLNVGILSPIRKENRRPSADLAKNATFVKRIRKSVLSSSQLPDPVVTSGGYQIHKPAKWG